MARLDEQSMAIKNLKAGLAPINRQKNHIDASKTYYSLLQIVPKQIDTLTRQAGKVATSERVLRSLLFDEIKKREEQIRPAYAETFNWIFDDDTTSFTKWLRSSDDVFWVNGKPGSGKSTLMKFLTAHPKTKEILRQWAGEEVIFASYFFWNSGSDIQKSQLGLMQSLVYQILRQCPDLIPLASTRRWDIEDFSDARILPWTRTELQSAIHNIIERGQLSAHFCFFIDGLDEYADDFSGDHYELIKFLDTLAQPSKVKLCVSSRPWTVFKDRYEKKGELKLVMQDLTSQDIYDYVEGQLQNDERFRQLASRDHQALELASHIRDKAEGVFLWVFLVVRSLLKGLTEHDDALELERRLSEIPSGLNAYLRKIFANIDPIYRQEAVLAFRLALVAAPMPLMFFWYIPMHLQDPHYALQMRVVRIGQNEVDASNDLALLRVNKWCRDLLEVKWTGFSEPGEVYFIHRTVKDFLLMEEIQMQLHADSLSDVNVPKAICMIYLAYSKTMGDCWTGHECEIFVYQIYRLTDWVNTCEKRHRTTQMKILDQVGRLWNAVMEQNKDSLHITGQSLHLAVKRGLCIYVGNILDRDPGAKIGLLQHALLKESIPKGSNEFSSPDQNSLIHMVCCLLEHGVDPNDLCEPDGTKNSTAWQRFLAVCYNSSTGGRHSLAEVMIHHGADLNAKVEVRTAKRGRMEHRIVGVRTCLLATTWGTLNESEKKHRVDELLAQANTMVRTKPLGMPSGQLKALANSPIESTVTTRNLGLRAKLKRLLK